jgi:hypothetical protein
MELSQPFLAVSGSNDVDPGSLQDRGNQVPDIVLVVDHKCPRHTLFIPGETAAAAAHTLVR